MQTTMESNLKFDDTIQCSFYTVSNNNLDTLCKELNEIVVHLSEDYIWHRDNFHIYVSVFDKEKKDIPVHLTSSTCFGDNVEDEWFIFYIVLQISRQYPDLVIQIEDNDGDFLLIEAAEFLPPWANPDTTTNRVFIYQSKIHLIPPEVASVESKLDLQDAVNLVLHRSNETTASTEIQQAVMERIAAYPQKIKESQHRALVTLPVDVAAVLKLKPYLISPIVLAFCNHDMLDGKCLKNVKFENCVTIPVLFTKFLYAMLVHSKLPQINKTSSSLKNNKKNSLGMKLASGYEIIMSKSTQNVFSSIEFNNFIKNLEKNGYFGHNIEGSKNYKERLETAKNYFSNKECPIKLYHCNNICELRTTEEFKNITDSLKNHDGSEQSDVTDDDEWLNINPDELNTFLNTHYGKKVVKNSNISTAQVTSDLVHFLNKTSDFEGIEYIVKESDVDNIEFDPDQFLNSIEKMLNLACGKNNTNDYDSEFSEDEEGLEMEDTLDKELASKLRSFDINNCKDENIVNNLIQSIQEEGISGPSSNVLKNIDA